MRNKILQSQQRDSLTCGNYTRMQEECEKSDIEKWLNLHYVENQQFVFYDEW